MNLQKSLLKKIKKEGHDIVVGGMKTRELLMRSFTINDVSKCRCKLSKEQQKYVKYKLVLYSDKFWLNVLCKIRNDRATRQAILQLNTSQNVPECIESFYFYIREDVLFCQVNSRSLDVKTKLYVDIEIAKRFCQILEKEFKTKLKKIKFCVGSMHYYL